MSFFFAAFLGIVQGLTEFLPISSSGHLVLIQRLIPNFSQPGVLFDVILHLGTVFAVLAYFRAKILKIDLFYLKLLIVGSIPAAIFGLVFRENLEATFGRGGPPLAIEFFITAAVCYFIDKLKGSRKTIGVNDSIWIGIAQALAIFPAISRSGVTIFTAAKRGIDKPTAAEFSFLLSVPAILGANALEIFSHSSELDGLGMNYLVGFLFAFVAGYISIFWTIELLKKVQFKYFALYAFLIGCVALFV